MISGIDPKVDYAFKRVFGCEQNLHILAHLLSSILKLEPDSKIVNLELLNPYSDKDSADDKLSIVDVRVRDLYGRQLHIEMQLLSEPAFSSRVLYYWSRLHSRQLKESNKYLQLRPTISVCIVNFKLFPDLADYYMDFQLRNEMYNCLFTRDIELITLELPKFGIPIENIKTPLEQWMHFLRFGDKLDIENLPNEIYTPEICEALETLQLISKDRLERERYEDRLRAINDAEFRISGTREVAHAEGLEQGHKQGHKQGLEQGRQEALLEARQRTCELALCLLKRRLGQLDTSILSRINLLDYEGLLLLTAASLDFNSTKDLSDWLSQR